MDFLYPCYVRQRVECRSSRPHGDRVDAELRRRLVLQQVPQMRDAAPAPDIRRVDPDPDRGAYFTASTNSVSSG